MYLQGISIKNIKVFLDSEGVKPRRSKTWNLQTILTMLRNRVYIGEYTWVDKESEEKFKIVLPQIISHSLFNRVHKKILKNTKNKGNNARKYESLLSDLLTCYCGENITGQHKKKSEKRVRKMYGCRSKYSLFKGKIVNHCLNTRTMNMDVTDDLVITRIKEVIGNSSILKEKFKAEVMGNKLTDSTQLSKEKKNLERTIKGIDQQIETTIKSISINEVNHMLKKTEDSRYKVISNLLEEELSQLEDEKKSRIQEIDDLDNQKDWVDWISKYGQDIHKRFKNPTTELLEGIIDEIVVSPVMGQTRDGKDTQRGHIFNIKFKLPIVDDSIGYKNEKNKSDGYSIKDGKKSTKTKELQVNNGNKYNHVYVDENSNEKCNLTGVYPNSLNSNGFG